MNLPIISECKMFTKMIEILLIQVVFVIEIFWMSFLSLYDIYVMVILGWYFSRKENVDIWQ